jgi:predicted kinase
MIMVPFSSPVQDAFMAQHPRLLIATVGLPRSGKSSWARQQGVPLVNPDAIRLSLHEHRFIGRAEPWVWAMAQTMVRALFEAGHSVVILDATNITRERRAMWKSRDWAVCFQEFTTSLQDCIKRALVSGSDPELVGAIERMASQREPLGADELLWPA